MGLLVLCALFFFELCKQLLKNEKGGGVLIKFRTLGGTEWFGLDRIYIANLLAGAQPEFSESSGHFYQIRHNQSSELQIAFMRVLELINFCMVMVK